MKHEYKIAGLVLDARAPRMTTLGLTVEVSVRGEKWECVADIQDTEPLNKRGRIKVSFDPVEVQHILITLTKPHGESWFWSIHELSVLPAEGNATQASRPRWRWDTPITIRFLALSAIQLRAARAPAPSKAVLLFCGSEGFRHTTCFYGKPAITQIGEDTGAFSTVCTEDSSFINDDFLAGIDCLVLNNSTGSFLDEEQRAALVRYVEGGGGLVGNPRRDRRAVRLAGVPATDGRLVRWPSVERGSDHRRGGPGPSRLRGRPEPLEDRGRDLPAARLVPQRHVRADEPEHRADEHGAARHQAGRPRLRHRVCRLVGQGRSFYTALGHRNEVMDDPVWQTHLLGGMRWAMGEVEGTSTPHPKPK